MQSSLVHRAKNLFPDWYIFRPLKSAVQKCINFYINFCLYSCRLTCYLVALAQAISTTYPVVMESMHAFSLQGAPWGPKMWHTYDIALGTKVRLWTSMCCMYTHKIFLLSMLFIFTPSKEQATKHKISAKGKAKGNKRYYACKYERIVVSST